MRHINISLSTEQSPNRLDNQTALSQSSYYWANDISVDDRRYNPRKQALSYVEVLTDWI